MSAAGYTYFYVGELDHGPTFYREPVGQEYQKLEVWLPPFGDWRGALPRRRINDTLKPVPHDKLPTYL